MNRREFLRFSRARGRRAAELSCQRLYMRVTDTRRANPADPDPTPGDGEPPAVFEAPTIEQVFADLDRDLREVDSLRVIDVAWLESSRDLKRRLDEVLDAFRSRGGRVEIHRSGRFFP